MSTPTPGSSRRTALPGAAIVAAMLIVGACGTASPPSGTPTFRPSPVSGSSPTAPVASPDAALTQLDASDVGRPLAAGTYHVGVPFGVPTSFSIPAGWSVGNLDQGDISLGSGNSWLVIDIVQSVFADPCESRDGPIDPPVGSTVDAVVGALSAMKGFTAGPIGDVALGAHAGKAFELRNSIDTHNTDCYGVATLPMWTYRGGTEVWTIGGQLEQMWVLEVQGTPLVVDRGGPGADEVAESLRFASPTAWTPAMPTPAPTGPRLSYVALGDSLLFADESDCGGGGCTSATVLYGEAMAAELGIPVDVHNLTMHNSLTTEGLRVYIERGAKFGRVAEDLWDAVAGADVVSVTIGFNDANNPNPTVIPTITKAYEADLERVLAKIEELRAGKPTAIRVTNMYNNGSRYWTPLVEAMNDVACDVAVRHDAICVDIYAAFNGPDGSTDPVPLGYFGPDGTHPSQKGMDVIAAALAAAGYEPLR